MLIVSLSIQYADNVHKSAGPIVFMSKTMGMLPIIWTEDEEESEGKSYFNLCTFIILIGWIFIQQIIRLSQSLIVIRLIIFSTVHIKVHKMEEHDFEWVIGLFHSLDGLSCVWYHF